MTTFLLDVNVLLALSPHLVNLAARVSAVLATFDVSLARALHPDDRRHVQVLDD